MSNFLNVTFERIPRPQMLGDSEAWSPTIPEHNPEHGNAGIDLSAATDVVASEVGVSSKLPSGYFEVTGSELSQADISFINSAIESGNTSLIANMEKDNIRIEYSSNSPKPLRMYEAVVRTGLRVHLPDGYHMRIASRSGLGFKRNILAFPGTIDNSYRGELMIKLFQFTQEDSPFEVRVGERIAQGILFSTPHFVIREGEVDTETHRGDKGFGSSGV